MVNYRIKLEQPHLGMNGDSPQCEERILGCHYFCGARNQDCKGDAATGIATTATATAIATATAKTTIATAIVKNNAYVYVHGYNNNNNYNNNDALNLIPDKNTLK
jgi:predicted secreted protein